MARKRSSKKGRSSRSSEHAGYIWEGVRTVLSWVGTLTMAIVALGQWLARQSWEVISGRTGRQPVGMALAAAAVFVFVALLDFRAGAPQENICGSFGYRIADLLLRALGIGAFLPFVFSAFWGFTRLFREKSSTNAPTKLLGVGVLTLVVAVTAHGLTFPERLPDRSFPRGLGGWIGETVFPRLTDSLGAFGVAVLLGLTGIVALLIATEWAFVPLIRDLARKTASGFRQGELPLEAPRRGAREIIHEAERNRERAARGFLRVFTAFGRLLSPFEALDDKTTPKVATAGAGAATAGAAPTKRSSIPLNVHAPSKSEKSGQTKSKSKSAEPAEEATVPATASPTKVEADEWERAGSEEEEWEWEEDGEEEEEYEYVYDEEEDPDAAEWEEEGEWEEEEEAPSPPEPVSSLPSIQVETAQRHETEGFEDVPAPKPKKRRKPTLTELPAVGLLKRGEIQDRSRVQAEIDALGQRLQAVFDAFGIDARVVGAERGPTLTLFEVQLATGVSVKKLKNQRDDLGVALGSHGVRIVYPLPGRSTVGVEVPNLKRETVRLRDVFEEVDTEWDKCHLPVILGRDTLGKPASEDLTTMPHMLVAGTTGSGKSVCLNSILVSWLLTRTPDQLRLVLIDPKQVELQLYKDIPHLLCPVVTDMKRAPFTLEWATRQMEDRLHLFKLAGVRNVLDYNALGNKELRKRIGEDAYDPEEFPDTLPLIVLVIDELADLMLVSAKEVEVAISRLAAKARAAGIHLVVATQRPSTDVVTGLIKMNLPTRIAFKVTSAVDSRVILDDSGADDLLGNGDFLYRPPSASGMIRGQGVFVTESEVRHVCEHLRQHGKPEFLDELVQMKGADASPFDVDDPLFDDAVRIVLQSGRGSASLLQRALSVGYTRASRLIDLMSEQGVVGPHTGSKAREILMTLEEWDQLTAQAE